MMPFGERDRGDISGLHFPKWETFPEGMGAAYMQEGHTSGLAPVLVLPAAWKGCFAVAAPEVLHLPAGEEFYFASVKY